jgi:hypothetical protein
VLAATFIKAGKKMHVSSTATPDKSWLQTLLIVACFFTSILSGLVTILLYVELRHGSEQIQELKQLVTASKAEGAACIHELRRTPSAGSASTFSTLPVTPLPAPIVTPRPAQEPARADTPKRVEKEGKSEIPENGTFVLVGEDGKGAESKERKFKLLGEK